AGRSGAATGCREQRMKRETAGSHHFAHGLSRPALHRVERGQHFAAVFGRADLRKDASDATALVNDKCRAAYAKDLAAIHILLAPRAVARRRLVLGIREQRKLQSVFVAELLMRAR